MGGCFGDQTHTAEIQKEISAKLPLNRMKDQYCTGIKRMIAHKN